MTWLLSIYIHLSVSVCIYGRGNCALPTAPLCKRYNGPLWTLSPEATLIPSMLIFCPQMNQELWLYYPTLHNRFHYDHKRHINVYLRGHRIHLKATSFVTCGRRLLASGLSPVKHRSVYERQTLLPNGSQEGFRPPVLC